VHVNNGSFYVLTDRNGDGAWESPHPLQLIGSTNTGLLFGNTIWHAGNDGAGSGLDADKLDGLEGSQFLRNDINLNVITAVSPSIHFNDTEAGYERRSYIGRWRNTFLIQERDSAGNYVRTPFIIEDGPTTQLRGKADGTWTISNNVIWHAGNDGAGSGLDADKLDGLESTQFLRADVNDTCSGVVTFTASNGVTLQHASGPLRFTGFGAGTGGTVWIHGQDGAGDDIFWMVRNAPSNYTVNFNGALQVSGSTVWHAGNDGPGSGLDADKLDGLDSSQFLRSDVDDTFTGILTIKKGAVGYLTLQATNGTRTGWINWYYPDNSRACYIGYADQMAKVVNWWFDSGNLRIDGVSGSGHVGFGVAPSTSYRISVAGQI
ncbi:MAG: hypothetical protein D6800_09195, partial [Candidatus Zixiibacteriota bacterium]